MLLNARKVFYEGNNSTSLLVAIEDVTERRALEREKDELLRQKDLLLQEMNHRINNSLQIIASILLLKAHTVQSEETRRHLQDAHERVMAVATVQEQLHPTPFGTQIEAKSYLTRLCESLAASMIIDDQPVSLRVEAGEGSTTSEQAVSMGLIATELVINALKHAFPGGAKGQIVVGFESTASAWRLAVSDDGVGISPRLADAPVRTGLGTSIVEALTRQLGGRITTSAASPGTTVSVTVPRVRHNSLRSGGRRQQRAPSRWLWRVRLDEMVFGPPRASGFRLRTLSASPLMNTCAIGPARSISSTAETPLPWPKPASTIIRSGP